MYPAKLVVLLCCLILGAVSIDLTWQGCTSNLWTDTACWAEGAAPTAADDVTIDISAVICTIPAAAACNSLYYNSADSTSMITIAGVLTVTTTFRNVYNGAVTIAPTGGIAGPIATASIDNGYNGVLLCAGTISIPITNSATLGCGGGGSISSDITNSDTFGIDSYGVSATVSGKITNSGTLSITGVGATVTGVITSSSGEIVIGPGADITEITTDSSTDIYMAPTSHIGVLTTSGTVYFQNTPGGVDACNIDSLFSDGGDFIMGNNSNTEISKEMNCTTSDTTFNGQGTFTLLAGSVSKWYSATINDNAVVVNAGWLELAITTTSSYSALEFYDFGSFVIAEGGQFVQDAGIVFYSPTTSVTNDGDITSNDDGTTNYAYACYYNNYYGDSTDTEFPNITNNGNITTRSLKLDDYMPLINNGGINVEELDLTSTTITFSADVDKLYCTGSDYTVVFDGELTVNELQTSGGGTFHSTGGNTTVEMFNSTGTTHWLSDDSSAFNFAGDFTSDSNDYLDGVTFVFLPETNQDVSSYWYFTASTVYCQGSFMVDGTYWTFEDSVSTLYNQGYFLATSYWYVYDSSADDPGNIYNVGIMRFTDGSTMGPNFGNCDGGLIQLADSDDTTYSGGYLTAQNRFACNGNWELVYGENVPDDYELTRTYVFSWSSSTVSAYPDDFDENGVPNTFQDESDFDVKIQVTEDGISVDVSFGEVDTCWYPLSYSLFVASEKSSFTGYDCESQPDTEKGMCDVPDGLPPATVDVSNPPGSTASSMVFSVLSVIIIASLFILF